MLCLDIALATRLAICERKVEENHHRSHWKNDSIPLLNDVSLKHGRWFHLGILNSFGCCGWKHGVCKASGKGSLLRNDHQAPDHFLPNNKNPPKIHGKISAQGNQKKFGFIDAKKSPNINHSWLKDNNLAVPSTEPEGTPGFH